MEIPLFARRGVMTVWYSYTRNLNSIVPWVTLRGKRIAVSRYCAKPVESEEFCAEYCRAGDRVLDMGCGCGVATVFCAPIAREVVAVDINPYALENTEENCKLHGLKNVTIMRSDMFSSVTGKFDLIVAHPPYIETEFEAEEKKTATSVRFVPMLFAQVGEHLAQDGRFVVQFPLRYRARIEKLASENGLKLVSVQRPPSKSLAVFLTSLIYFQIGFQTTFYLLQHQAANAANAPKA